MTESDTISWRLTKGTRKEIERWRKKIADVLGIDINSVTYKESEIALRECAKTGKIRISTLRDIKLGKIK